MLLVPVTLVSVVVTEVSAGTTREDKFKTGLVNRLDVHNTVLRVQVLRVQVRLCVGILNVLNALNAGKYVGFIVKSIMSTKCDVRDGQG